MSASVVALAITALTAVAIAGDSLSQFKKTFYKELLSVQTFVTDLYAPLSFKQNLFGLSLEKEYHLQVKKVAGLASPTTRDFQAAVKNLLGSTRDYHVSVNFYSTESATLPLSFAVAENRVFLVAVDRQKLTHEAFPFAPGDELIRFAGRPALEALREVESEFVSNVTITDRSLAAMMLTRRLGRRGMIVPQGGVNLVLRKQNQISTSEVTLAWTYSPEKIKPLSPPIVESLHGVVPIGMTSQSSLLRRQFTIARPELMAVPKQNEPFALGNREGFLPIPGEILWRNPEASLFDAAIFKTSDGRKVGWIRIANYTPENALAYIEEFAYLVGKMEAETEILTIDQTHNPGGSAFYLYALASWLTPQPLLTPHHKMTITQAEVMEAVTMIEQLEKIKTDEEAKKVLGDSLDGYPVGYVNAQLLLGYFRFVVQEWEKGHQLTEPWYLYGVDQIQPAAKPYSKPILVITDELDFSGGDFFPAILQDNHRAVIFGTRTAGAGGYIMPLSFPNMLGIKEMVLTGSLALRAQQLPIENLGVQPDIPYSFSARDFEGLKFEGFQSALQTALSQL